MCSLQSYPHNGFVSLDLWCTMTKKTTWRRRVKLSTSHQIEQAKSKAVLLHLYWNILVLVWFPLGNLFWCGWPTRCLGNPNNINSTRLENELITWRGKFLPSAKPFIQDLHKRFPSNGQESARLGQVLLHTCVNYSYLLFHDFLTWLFLQGPDKLCPRNMNRHIGISNIFPNTRDVRE